ncbi:DNA helicase, partial [Tanacetum coccineum]
MDSNFTNENDPWEYSLDIDDSDLHLTPVLRSSSSAHVEPSPYTPNPVTIIPLPSQACLKNVFILDPDGALMSTQEYMQKVIEDVGEDANFNSGAWVSATNYVNAFVEVLFLRMLFGDLNVTLKDLSGTVPKTIHYKVLDVGSYEKDITVGAAMILANVSVFTPKPSKHYLNITKRNVIEIPIIAPTIPPSPDYTPASPDYSPASETEPDPSEDPSSDHIPSLPAISLFLSSTNDTTYSAREYDLPTSDTLGAIVFESGPDTRMNYDVIIEPKDGFPQRINMLHKSYMSLKFPLLFVYGQSGYYPEMKQRDDDDKRISMNNYYMYQLHELSGLYGLLLRGGRLFQQYVVGVYCCIEQNRIDYYRTHQNDIRRDYLSGVYDALHRGDHVGSDIGGKFILPRTFTGGPWYTYSHYLDALAICRVLGNPQFFITFTCNVNWPEIKRRIEDFPGLTPADRANVVKQKIEDAQEVDEYIFAELPNQEEDPEGYKVVSEMMVHGLCGL